jgi:replicative DNA helicase
MGKTALALNIAENVATANPYEPRTHAVGIFSLEMSSEQLVHRMLFSHSRVESYKLRTGSIYKDAHAKLTDAASALMRAPIYLDDTAGLSVLELRSRARRMKKRFGIELLVVDYLQMLSYPQYAKEGRQREVSAISGSLKAMAKELHIPVIVLSQLSRAPETRDRKAVPRLSDLRDSGSIEQDADVVCLLRRPCKYPEDPKRDDTTLAILDVAKHRNGKTAELDLNFFEEFTRFEDRARGVDGEAPFDPSSGGVEE